MRPFISATLLALSLGAITFSPSFSLSQEQPEAQRKVVSKVDPMYPQLANKMQLTGIVRVEAIVAPNGKAKFIQVIGGNPVLAKAAVDAVEKWKWVSAPQETKELVVLYFRP
jgi:TonB family protein